MLVGSYTSSTQPHSDRVPGLAAGPAAPAVVTEDPCLTMLVGSYTSSTQPHTDRVPGLATGPAVVTEDPYVSDRLWAGSDARLLTSPAPLCRVAFGDAANPPPRRLAVPASGAGVADGLAVRASSLAAGQGSVWGV